MGLSERRTKQKIGNDPRNLAWRQGASQNSELRFCSSSFALLLLFFSLLPLQPFRA
ncbi:hypothetical protein BDY24DRAFT_400736 [Mrakia frigida]|uniref:uncharacterized protein n=1 Tax=Mrakia frigida TaxID=29902 RepID=UPI003FCC1663